MHRAVDRDHIKFLYRVICRVNASGLHGHLALIGFYLKPSWVRALSVAKRAYMVPISAEYIMNIGFS
jgi:hypothetical protein